MNAPKGNTVIVGVRLLEEEIKQIDDCIRQGKSISRSDYVRMAVRRALNESCGETGS